MKEAREGRKSLLYALSVLSLAFAACSAPRFDPSTVEGKAAILDRVNQLLTDENCAGAIVIIEPVYESVYTDNKVRLARASAQGCAAGISNLFNFMGILADQSGLLGTNGFWKLMTQFFYNATSTTLDSRIQAGENATDALVSTLKPGSVISLNNQINPDTDNVGSVVVTDREDDANTYLMFVAMSQIGSMQSRYGAPNSSTFVRGQILGATGSDVNGWTKASNIDETACAYAAGVLNLIDTMTEISGKMQGKLKTGIDSFLAVFGTQIGLACNAGCRGTVLNLVTYAGTGCAFADDDCLGTSAVPCPVILRDRTACTGVVSNRASCAAAGIARYVSADPLGWQ